MGLVLYNHDKHPMVGTPLVVEMPRDTQPRDTPVGCFHDVGRIVKMIENVLAVAVTISPYNEEIRLPDRSVK